MESLKNILRDEIAEFREKGHKFLNGELTVAEFKGISGGMGAYAQKGGKEFMIRLRIPCGVFGKKEIKLVEKYLKQFNIPKLHLTTRQAIQLHDLSIDQVCDIMQDCLENELYTRGGGGNFPRNVTLSPLSGVAQDEAFDVTPYALMVNDYFIKRMNQYKLPRKLKVAFSNNFKDTTNATVTDLGFLAVNKDGKQYFKLYIAGGLGKNPAAGVEYDKLVNTKDVLYHVEAMTRLFIEEGNYENKNKARTRYIVSRMGKEEFLKCYKKHFEKVKKDLKLDCVKDNPYSVDIHSDIEKNIENDNCIVSQKQKGLYTVIVQPICGQMNTEDFIKIADFVDKHKNAEIRLSMTESMYIRNLNADETVELLDITKDFRQKTKLEQSLSCIGVPTCQMGIEQSQKLTHNIIDYFNNKGLKEDILPSIAISGCNNSCSRHQINDIGFSGTRVKIGEKTEDAFTLHVGGNFSEKETHLGKVYGNITMDNIPEFLYKVALKIKEKNIDFISYYNDNKNEFEEILEEYIVK